MFNRRRERARDQDVRLRARHRRFDRTHQRDGALAKVSGIPSDGGLAESLELWHPSVDRLNQVLQVFEHFLGGVGSDLVGGHTLSSNESRLRSSFHLRNASELARQKRAT